MSASRVLGGLSMAIGVALAPMVSRGPAAAVRQDKLIGLLSLPEVFGAGACDKFTPATVPLYAMPDFGPTVASIRVDQYWTFQDVGGCEGLIVNVHSSGRQGIQPLPMMEYTYEAPAAIVLEQRGRWFRVRLTDEDAWLHASERAEYFSLERLLTKGLTYLSEGWDGRLAQSPGESGEELRGARPDLPVQVFGFRQHDGELWVEAAVLSHSICESNEEPRVSARGWLPAYARSGEPAIWFYPRGC